MTKGDRRRDGYGHGKGVQRRFLSGPWAVLEAVFGRAVMDWEAGGVEAGEAEGFLRDEVVIEKLEGFGVDGRMYRRLLDTPEDVRATNERIGWLYLSGVDKTAIADVVFRRSFSNNTFRRINRVVKELEWEDDGWECE